MRALAIAAVICLSGFAVQMAAAQESKTVIWLSPSRLVAEGASLIDRGKVLKGKETTLEALEQDLAITDRAAAFNNLCTADLAQRLYRDAIKHCSSAVKLRASLWQGYNNRANAHFLLGEYDKAISDYGEALRIMPDLDIIEYNLALATDYKRRSAPPPVMEWEG